MERGRQAKQVGVSGPAVRTTDWHSNMGEEVDHFPNFVEV